MTGYCCPNCKKACPDCVYAKVSPMTGSPRHHRGDMFALWDTWGKKDGAVLVVTVNATTTNPHGRPLELGQKFGPMGKGCALTAARRYPELQKWWSKKLSCGFTGGLVHGTPVRPDPNGSTLDRLIVLLVTKINWWEKSSYALVDQGLCELMHWSEDAEKAGRGRFVMPLPGAGAGGLDPDICKKLCRKYLDGRFVVCTPA